MLPCLLYLWPALSPWWSHPCDASVLRLDIRQPCSAVLSPTIGHCRRHCHRHRHRLLQHSPCLIQVCSLLVLSLVTLSKKPCDRFQSRDVAMAVTVAVAACSNAVQHAHACLWLRALMPVPAPVCMHAMLHHRSRRSTPGPEL